MSSQDVRRSQRVAVPSSKVLENAPACVRVFWSYISEAVKSNTEDRTEIRTLIANIRKAYADLTEIGEPSDDVQRVYELMVDELRNTIVDLLSSGSECLSGISRRSRHKLELPTDKATHAFSQEQKKEKTLTHDDIMAETRIQYKSIVTTMGNPGKPSSHHRQNLPSVRCPLTEKTRTPNIEPAETYGMSRSKSHIVHALDNKHTTKAQLHDNRQHNHRRSQSQVSDVELQDERSSICQKRLLLEHELNELGRLEEELNTRRAQRATDELLLRRQEDRLNARSSQEESTSDIAKLAAALSESIQLSRMPQPEIPKFNGDPIEYHSWRATFDYLVTNRNIHPKEKLCFLQQSISDKVLKMTALKNLQSEEAFQRAMALLSEKFDDPFHVIESYRNMLSDFKPIAEHDHKRLQDFSDLLSQVEIAYETINGLDMLDDPHELTALSHKLPMHIRRKFASTFYNKKKQGFYPTFRELVNLVVTESALLNDPQIAQILQKPRTESQQKRVFAASTTESAMTVVSRDSCKYCDAPGHMIVECRKLGKLTPKDKESYIKENRLCYGCLVQGHKSTACYKRSVCNECKGRHPTSIHGMYEALHPSSKPITNNNKSDGSTRKERDTSDSTHTKDERDTSSSTTKKYPRHDVKNADKNDDERKETVNAHNKRTMSTKASPSVYTMIVPVYVSTKQQPTHEVLTYAMIDSQSDTSFITDSIAENLKAKFDDVNLSIMTMCSTTDVACKKYQGLQVRGMNASTIVTLPSMYGRDDIPSDISQVGTKETTLNHSHLHQIQHQVPSLQDCGIGILIGCDCSIVMTPLRVIPGSPLAQETCLGWSIVGSDERVSTKTMQLRTQATNDGLNQSDDLKDKVVVTHHISKRDEFNHIAKLLESDFKEDRGCDQVVSQEDLMFLNIVRDSMHKNEEGFYESKLPLKDRNTVLPNNIAVAAKRLEYLKTRLVKNQQYCKDYTKFMTDVLVEGDAEVVPKEDMDNRNSYYIPHHGIYHRKKPEKIRVVFDCSSIYQGKSLNSLLLQGPSLLNSLVGILCRFRKETVGFIGDIQKMYHRFHVAPDDRNMLRFLWYKNGDLSTEPIAYRMKVFVFGAVCSPAVANYGLKKLAADGATEDNQVAVTCISENFYVDDWLQSAASDEEAIKVIKDARSMCKEANVRLHKFVSNSQKVSDSIPESERAQRNTHDLVFEEDHLDRVLGLQWSTTEDDFHFNLDVPVKPNNRRGVLSIVASIYDPLGLLAPFTLRGKLLLQSMCCDGMSWDQLLDGALEHKWKKWLAELQHLKNVRVPRCFKPHNFGKVKTYQLHHFCDASLQAYGQCSYLRLTNENGDIHCSLVMAKARVAPKKVLSIVRLELMAAVTAVKISKFLRHELQYDDIEEFFWTDSKIILAYLQNDAKRFHIFVSNRVQLIQDASSMHQWRHVPSEDNQADHVSRGLKSSEIMASNWLPGPAFLWKPLPEPEVVPKDIPTDNPEVKTVIVRATRTNESDAVLEYVSHFSNWYRAVRHVMLLRRPFLKKLKKLPKDETTEMHDAETFILKCYQSVHFDEEISSLKMQQPVLKAPLGSLDLMLDEKLMLRVGGRLKRSCLDYGVKHPIILPKVGQITNLILKHYHDLTRHQGRAMTISKVRENGYYVLGVTRLVASLVYNCTVCRRLRHATQEQKMADLPCERLEPSEPFQHVAIDCFGPYHVKDRRTEVKRYGLIIVCQASRAIHLEVLDDMTTDCFINSLRCVIAIRGKITSIRCDQGSNFIGASAELKASFKNVDDAKVRDALLKSHCNFMFNSPESSHMGGCFERHIRTVRSILNQILFEHSHRLDTASLRTYMYEVMALVNSRPLGATQLNDSRLDPLTPNHLIMMKSNCTTPAPGSFAKEDVFARKRWRQVQFMTGVFWSRWRSEYLLNLQHRQKWTMEQRSMKIGDIVVIRDDNVYRGEWKLGKVVEVLGSKDHTRRVKILVGDREQFHKKKTYLERPVHKLVLLVENSV